ncbi:MAG TPA: Crp/Fnr family transcriptional regulator [Methylotenera sp.]|nr:Crp/Fnr family transcriptional regulator [Methylotenera sp.]
MQLKQRISPVNNLLAGLTEVEYQRLMTEFETIDLMLNEVICNAGDQIHYVYFPIKSIIALMNHLDADKNLEVGMIGNEGMLGSTLLLGVNTAPFRAVVQNTGATLRMPAATFTHELQQSLVFEQQLKRYLYVSLSQLVQNATCNRFHVIEERLACLLLRIRDRVQSQSFHITQESLAQMLGVRRVGVTMAAKALQHKKIISYSRGNLRIHDNVGLEAISCSCYQTNNETYSRILNA